MPHPAAIIPLPLPNWVQGVTLLTSSTATRSISYLFGTLRDAKQRLNASAVLLLI